MREGAHHGEQKDRRGRFLRSARGDRRNDDPPRAHAQSQLGVIALRKAVDQHARRAAADEQDEQDGPVSEPDSGLDRIRCSRERGRAIRAPDALRRKTSAQLRRAEIRMLRRRGGRGPRWHGAYAVRLEAGVPGVVASRGWRARGRGRHREPGHVVGIGRFARRRRDVDRRSRRVGGSPGRFLLLPAWLPIRMAMNAIDGMLAREFGQTSPMGAYLNELSDVVSDAALYAPFAFVAPFGPWSVGVVILASCISELAGALGPRSARRGATTARWARAIARSCSERSDSASDSSERCRRRSSGLMPGIALLIGWNIVNRVRRGAAAAASRTQR